MAKANPRHDTESRLFPLLKADVGQVASDVLRRGVGREVSGTFSGLETFYLSEGSRQRLAAMKPLPRFFTRVWWLTKSLLLKFTPARRILLAAALAMLALGVQRIELETGALSLRFQPVASLLLLLVLMLELRDKLVARDELEAGRTVQLALMPDRSPAVPGWDLWLHTEPANDVGGDLVDHLQIDDRRYGVALGDIAGKALPAALLMVKLQATLRALVPRCDSLSALGARVNEILVRDGLPNRFATLVYLLLTADSGDVRWLNAGHMAPLAIRNGIIDELPGRSIALGIVSGLTFLEHEARLDPGDTLVVYSDGVSEAMNSAGDFFGEERLRAALREVVDLPVDAVGAHVLRQLESFAGDAPRHDDVSLVVLRRRAV